MKDYSSIVFATMALLLVSAVRGEEQATQGIDANADQTKLDGVLPGRSSYHGVQENLFRGHSWYTPPPPPPRRAAPVSVKRAPVAPPLPFELLGSYEEAGSPTVYFLVKADRIYDVVVGDTIDKTYNVDSVSNGKLMFTYLPLKTSQGLRLGE